MPPRDAFPGYDDPVNIDMEPEAAVKLLIGVVEDDSSETPSVETDE